MIKWVSTRNRSWHTESPHKWFSIVSIKLFSQKLNYAIDTGVSHRLLHNLAGQLHYNILEITLNNFFYFKYFFISKYLNDKQIFKRTSNVNALNSILTLKTFLKLWITDVMVILFIFYLVLFNIFVKKISIAFRSQRNWE